MITFEKIKIIEAICLKHFHNTLMLNLLSPLDDEVTAWTLSNSLCYTSSLESLSENGHRMRLNAYGLVQLMMINLCTVTHVLDQVRFSSQPVLEDFVTDIAIHVLVQMTSSLLESANKNFKAFHSQFYVSEDSGYVKHFETLLPSIVIFVRWFTNNVLTSTSAQNQDVLSKFFRRPTATELWKNMTELSNSIRQILAKKVVFCERIDSSYPCNFFDQQNTGDQQRIKSVYELKEDQIFYSNFVINGGFLDVGRGLEEQKDHVLKVKECFLYHIEHPLDMDRASC